MMTIENLKKRLMSGASAAHEHNKKPGSVQVDWEGFEHRLLGAGYVADGTFPRLTFRVMGTLGLPADFFADAYHALQPPVEILLEGFTPAMLSCHDALTSTFQSSHGARQLLPGDRGTVIPAARINFCLSPKGFWAEIVEMAAREKGALEHILECARGRYPMNPKLIDAQRGLSGSPAYVPPSPLARVKALLQEHDARVQALGRGETVRWEGALRQLAQLGQDPHLDDVELVGLPHSLTKAVYALLTGEEAITVTFDDRTKRAREVLVQIFSEPDRATMIAGDAGLDRRYLNKKVAGLRCWNEIIDEANVYGRLWHVLETARQEYPDNRSLREVAGLFV